MEPVVSDLCTAGTVGGSGTRRTAAVRDTESRSGLIPLPEAAVSGVRKQGWNSSSPVLELCPYLPHCTATEGCRRSLKEGPSSRRDGGLSEHGAVGGGLWKAPSDPSRRPLPAAPAALAVPVNLLLTEEALDVGSEGRSQKTEPLSLLAHPCACSGGEGLRHAGCGPRATSLCGRVLATVVETLGSRFCPRRARG